MHFFANYALIYNISNRDSGWYVFLIQFSYNWLLVALQVNSFVGAFHDAVILYALALNETLEAGHSASNGTEITHRMWNRNFTGKGNDLAYFLWVGTQWVSSKEDIIV